MIVIKGVLNRPVGMDARDAIAPPGFEPYQDPGPQKGAADKPGGVSAASAEGVHAKGDTIVPQYLPTSKTFSTTQANAARGGHELTQSRDAATGLVLWQVSRWGQSRQFSEWSDVCAFVARIGQHGSASMGGIYATIFGSVVIIAACIFAEWVRQ